jgi:MtrB/PioB family decaheme-associated outer membrane protein
MLMKTSRQIAGFSQSAIALAVLAAFNPAQAQIPPHLDTPVNSVSVGIGGASGETKDRAQFGIYNGLREHDTNLLLDFDYRSLADPAGFFMKFEGRNLGLDNRELRGALEKQGDWKISAEYNEITKHSPYTINTGMTGAGSTTPTVVRLTAPGTGSDVDLKTERKSGTIAAQKWLTSGLLFEASLKSEDKDGARLWGRGYDCAAYVCGSSTVTAMNQSAFVKNALLLLPEPINSNIKQIEAKFTFHDEKLMATAGYYGSIYSNSNGNLSPTVPTTAPDGFNNGLGLGPFPGYPAVTGAIIPGGGMSLQQVLQTPMALWPDNQAHQVYVSGNYAFTPSTRATFKYAFTRNTQNESFDGMGLAGYPVANKGLNGHVDTTLAQLGLTSRPLDKLSVNANWRYEHKQDSTPMALYNVEAVGANPATTPQTYTNGFWNNGHVTRTTVNAKLDASYQLPAGYRLTGGIDYSSLERTVPEDIKEEKTAGLTALREKNTEYGYRLELMKSVSETLTGRLSYAHSERRGSNWTSLSTLDPATPGISAANLALINTYCNGIACYGQKLPDTSIVALSSTVIFPMQMTDVDRDKWKLMVSWTPSDRLALQFMFEDGKEKTQAPANTIAGPKGWRDYDKMLYSIDASYALSDKWKLTGYAMRAENATVHINHSTGYIGDLKTKSDAYGLGVTGNVSDRFQIGANVAHYSDVNQYAFDAAPSATGAPPSANNLAQAAIGLPDVVLKKTTLAVFGNYAMAKNSDIRVDVVHQQTKLDEWVWGYNGVPFTYADNTTVSQKQTQSVTFIGARYIYKFK